MLDKFQEWKFKVREYKLLRALFFPYMQARIFVSRLCYAHSEDSARVAQFHRKYTGKRCFIIGNGPSLTAEDLGRLKGEYTFSANRIFRIFARTDWRPTFWLCVDPYLIHQLKRDTTFLHKMPETIRFVSERLEPQSDCEYRIFNDQRFRINKYGANPHVPFSANAAAYVASGETVTYTAIQMAAYMGFEEIYLLGVDHSYAVTVGVNGQLTIDRSIKDYFEGIRPDAFTRQFTLMTNAAYQSALNYATKHGIRILNATRGGKLEVFSRVNLDTILEK